MISLEEGGGMRLHRKKVQPILTGGREKGGGYQGACRELS